MRQLDEAGLDRMIGRAAARCEIFAYHVPDSRRSAAGFPDWVLIGSRGLLFRECKSARGKLSPKQRELGYRLQALGYDWDIWRPEDWDTARIWRELQAIA